MANNLPEQVYTYALKRPTWMSLHGKWPTWMSLHGKWPAQMILHRKWPSWTSLHGFPQMTRPNDFTWKMTRPNEFTREPSNESPEWVYTANDPPECAYTSNDPPKRIYMGSDTWPKWRHKGESGKWATWTCTKPTPSPNLTFLIRAHMPWVPSHDTTCHAPTLVVLFQLHYRRCGTTDHFLFTNTCNRGLHLLSMLSLFSSFTKYMFSL